MGVAVALDGVTVSYREWNRRIDALSEVDLSLNAGAFCGLVGSNASGKSTVLRLLAGLCRPESGSVRVHGADPCKAETRQDIFWMGEKPVFPSQARVKELFAWTAKLRGRLGALSFADGPFGLTDLWERRVHRLSQGSLQKVALGLADVFRPSLLLLDEPYTGLDYWTARALTGQLRAWRESGMTIILSTHDWKLAEELAEVFWVLDRGKLLHAGPLDSDKGIASLFDHEMGVKK